MEARLDYAVRRGSTVSQSELARLVGVTPQAWSGWEAGLSEPALATLERAAEVLGVTPGWLAFGQFPRLMAELQEPIGVVDDEYVQRPKPKRRAK